MSLALALKMVHGTGRDSGAPLTSREVEVLKHVALGHTNKQVAEILHISPKTVDSHRTRIMAKLPLHSTAGLVRFAVKMGIIQP